MIIRKLPRTVILTVERLVPGDVVYGRMANTGSLNSGSWHLFDSDEIFKVTSSVMSLSNAMQRVNGKTLEGLDTWVLVDFGSHMLVEDRS